MVTTFPDLVRRPPTVSVVAPLLLEDLFEDLQVGRHDGAVVGAHVGRAAAEAGVAAAAPGARDRRRRRRAGRGRRRLLALQQMPLDAAGRGRRRRL